MTRTKIGRTWKNLDIESLNKQREPFKPNTSRTHEQRKFHKWGGIGHLVNNCVEKENINEIVETEDHNDKEEEYDSEKDTEESETSEGDKINIINSPIHKIDLIYKLLDVNQRLPKVGTYTQASQIYKMPNCIEPNLKKEWDIQLKNQE
ncbi:hypothetical protein O181_027891 [Austropuccinia psidii MF-1]|uniref:Uncharacterized protein n=1 Tax=Austropuccinia psidii MF-1 TaxID=1389203 RepID=A0A9Q3CN50_9BASI|nr:hypothetical protein [Austropuccinia psidii MF-1]